MIDLPVMKILIVMIVIGLVAIFLNAGYIKASPDTAFIISGFKKNQEF